MKIIPDTREEWQSIVKTSVRGGALIFDKLLTGGALNFLVNLGIEKRSSKALCELKDISLKLKEEIRAKIDLDYIKSDEFMIFISDSISEALKVKNIEKISYFRSAIINGLIAKDAEGGKKLLFVDCLSNLSVDSLILLKLIDSMCAEESLRDNRINFGELKERGKYNEANYMMANLKTLERYHLIETIRPTVMTEAYWDSYLVIYGTFGKEFIVFISGYTEN